MNSDVQRLVERRLPLLPGRVRPQTPRTGTHVGGVQQQIGDAYWRCGVEVAKPIYSSIDARYPFVVRQSSETAGADHARKMSEARKILNEARNDVLEAVLPLFHVRPRKDGESIDEADMHAHDYIVRNIFDSMVSTYKAWTDQFVESEEVDTLERTIDKVAAIQRERLGRLLVNFYFDFVDLSVHPKGKTR